MGEGVLRARVGRERGCSTPALSHLFSSHAQGNKLASAVSATAALRGGQSDPLEGLYAALDSRGWLARAAGQVLTDTQPVLRVSVAEAGRSGHPRQCLCLVARDSLAVLIQRRQIQLRSSVASLGGLGVALGGLNVVLGDALPAGKIDPSEELGLGG